MATSLRRTQAARCRHIRMGTSLNKALASPFLCSSAGADFPLVFWAVETIDAPRCFARTHFEVSFPNMLRRAWRLGVAARRRRGVAAAVSPGSADRRAGRPPSPARALVRAAPLSSRADGPDEEQRASPSAPPRGSPRARAPGRRGDVTPRELRELKDGGGSKRRWARDWASAVFADDVGDGASYEAFVAEALRHGDGRRGPGSGPASDTGADTRRARREKSVRRAGGSGAPKGGGTRGVKYKHRRGDAKSSRRRETSRRRRGARDDDFADDPVEWHEEHACDEADAFWRAFLRAARGTSRVGGAKKRERSRRSRNGPPRGLRTELSVRGLRARARARFGNHPRRRRRRPVARRLRHVSRPLGAGDRAWRGTEQNAPEVVAARGGDEVAPGPPRRRRRQARRRGGVQKCYPTPTTRSSREHQCEFRAKAGVSAFATYVRTSVCGCRANQIVRAATRARTGVGLRERIVAPARRSGTTLVPHIIVQHWFCFLACL